jgi:phage gpG-like protein
MFVDITIGSDDFHRAIKRIESLLEHPTPITKRVAYEVLPSAIEDNFFSEGARGEHSRWLDLSDRRVAERRAKGTWPGKILQDEGRLIDSFYPEFTETSASISNDLVYASSMDQGDTSRNIPAREFLFLTEEDFDDIAGIVRDEVEKIL